MCDMYVHVCVCMVVYFAIAALNASFLSLIPCSEITFYIKTKKDSNLSIIERTCNLFSCFKKL